MEDADYRLGEFNLYLTGVYQHTVIQLYYDITTAHRLLFILEVVWGPDVRGPVALEAHVLTNTALRQSITLFNN